MGHFNTIGHFIDAGRAAMMGRYEDERDAIGERQMQAQAYLASVRAAFDA